jgi:DNA-directed RNA polymerase I subunit RPA1
LLVGKEGTIRGKIMGKQADKLGRCVIACNTKISPDEVIIPQQFAMTVFVQEKVMDFNYERLLKFFKNGPT